MDGLRGKLARSDGLAFVPSGMIAEHHLDLDVEAARCRAPSDLDAADGRCNVEKARNVAGEEFFRRRLSVLDDVTVVFFPIGCDSLRVQLLEHAIESAMEAEGTFIAINNHVSQSVPHLHVHIVPRKKKDGLRGFFWPRQAYQTDAEMKAVQTAIQKALA